MEFILPTFTVSNIISLGIALYLAVLGFMQTFTGKVYGNRFERYTTESVKKYARPSGILLFLVGAIILFAQCVEFPTSGSIKLVLYGIALALVLIYLIFSLVVLKKEK